MYDHNNRFIHLYYGNGKGKTSAAVGVAVRASGRGNTVVFSQFYKNGMSGEIEPLKKMGIKVLISAGPYGFTSQLSETEIIKRAESQKQLFFNSCLNAIHEGASVLVLDEFADVLNDSLIDENGFASQIEFLDNCDIVITGHNPPVWLSRYCNYITNFICEAHPFQNGVRARCGIEY